MKGFPIQLYSETQKMFFDDKPMFGFNGEGEIFYSVKDGNWLDVDVWETVSGRCGILPTSKDTVYILNKVFCYSLCYAKNVFVHNNLYITSNVLFVYGSMSCTGILTMTGGSLYLFGLENYIDKSKANLTGSSRIAYVSLKLQKVLDLNYLYLDTFYNNSISGSRISYGQKFTAGYIFIGRQYEGYLPNGNVARDYTIENSELTATNSFSVVAETILINSSIVVINDFYIFGNYSLRIDANSSVESKSGLIGAGGVPCNISGNGLLIFSTNNSNIAFSSVISCNILIKSGIEITSVSLINFYGSITGEASSKFINSSTFYIMTNSAMSIFTGITFDYATFNNIVWYSIPGNSTIFGNTYRGLGYGGTGVGVVSLSANTTVGYLDSMWNSGNLQCGTYNLTVNGTAGISSLSKSGAGNILFVGLVTGKFGSGSSLTLTGNPTVEFRGGFNSYLNNSPTGSGDWIFSTNNQIFTSRTIVGYCAVSYPILISGAITLTVTITQSGNILVFVGLINGDNASSKWDNRGDTRYLNSQEPMQTGLLECSIGVNTFRYIGAAQEIKGTTYYNLELGGSGVKKLMGNVVVTGTYTLSGTATVDLNGFTIT